MPRDLSRVAVPTLVTALGMLTQVIAVILYQLGTISGPVLAYALVIAGAVTVVSARSLPHEERRRVIAFVVVITLVAGLLGYRNDISHSLFMSLTVAGLALGGIFALSGIGLVVTYRATGIFNFAHGSIAMFVAYVTWQFQQQWNWPLFVAAPFALLVVGPGIGVFLERFVFRSLQQRGASTAEKLVTTVGILVVLIGVATLLWTPQTRTDPTRLFPDEPVRLGFLGENVVLGSDQLIIIGTSLLLTGLLVVLFAYTPIGMQIRAVVDRRELAELTSVDANKVSAISWALGCGLAGLAGVLLAPTTFGLDPVLLTLLVIETFSVAVVARLASIPLAVLGGLALGILNAYSVRFDFERVAGALGFSPENAEPLGAFFNPVLPYLSVFLLFGALLVYKSLGEGADADEGSFVARSSVAGSGRSARARWRLNASVVAGLVLLPLVIGSDTFEEAHMMLALAIVFLSIVAVTGFSGHITLGQAAFAGFGGFVTARLVNGAFFGLPGMPVIVAMIVGALVCVPVGLFAGYPALRRRGLFLGLTTLALGLVMERFVFLNFYFVGSRATSQIGAPSFFGVGLGGDTAFYYYELAILAVAVFFTHRLRSGRLGRILGAMRDSETAATSIGLDLRKYKLFIFSASAFLAGIGGSLITQRSGTFDGLSFLTLNSLFWFTVVVVAGVTSIYGALLGAFIFTLLGVLLGNEGLSFLIIGLAAILMGRLPGGLVGLFQRISTIGAPASLASAMGWDAGQDGTPDEQPAPRPRRALPRHRLAPSPLGRKILARGNGNHADRRETEELRQ